MGLRPNAPPGFQQTQPHQPTFGFNGHQQALYSAAVQNQSASSGSTSQETQLPHAFNTLTLQDLANANWNMGYWSPIQSVQNKKARLVANGSTQLAGIDVDETFSPVVKPATIRTVLSLAISRHWPVHQLDVKNAFLHESLSKTVYMHQPPGFRDLHHPDHVCLLQRSLYGLKQALRAWFQRFAAYAARVGFHHSRCDSLLFIYRQGANTAYLLLYVDDIVLTASSFDICAPISDSTYIAASRGLTVNLTFTRLTFQMLSARLCLYAMEPPESPSNSLLSRGSYCPEAKYRVLPNALFKHAGYVIYYVRLHTLYHVLALVYCDNVSAVYLSLIPVQHQRTKHIEIDNHFVRDLCCYQTKVLYRVLPLPVTLSVNAESSPEVYLQVCLIVSYQLSDKSSHAPLHCGGGC
ncbi:ribonuclease H-like domain-containing protein [Tanacetum coccineum]|uniref:Ribonuclease H-like domain-containing protein n=1 Tax=Tanacetum coccineum TaxID=301880 RepID=A0ABQ4YDN0_9ASTR